MIIYLHGFASSANSLKAKQLRQWLAPRKIHIPDYNPNPTIAIPFLRAYIYERQRRHQGQLLVLIGSSLGGFYAQYLARQFTCGVVLINPALQPMHTLCDCVGMNKVYQTGETFEFTRDQLQALERFDIQEPCAEPVPTLILLDERDEIVDASVAMRKYADCGELHLFKGGSHAFDHLQQSIETIAKFHDNLGMRRG